MKNPPTTHGIKNIGACCGEELDQERGAHRRDRQTDTQDTGDEAALNGRDLVGQHRHHGGEQGVEAQLGDAPPGEDNRDAGRQRDNQDAKETAHQAGPPAAEKATQVKRQERSQGGTDAMWFAISESGMGPISRWTNTLLAGGHGRSGVDVGSDQIRVQMGDFKLTVPRASIRSASRSQADVGGTYGMHHRSGRWLVNGSADGLVELTIEVKSLTLSLADPNGFVAALQLPGQR